MAYAVQHFPADSLLALTGTMAQELTGQLYDPDVVELVISPPHAPAYTLRYGVDAALVRLGTGVYQTQLVADVRGAWGFRFASDGAEAAAATSYFTVG